MTELWNSIFYQPIYNVLILTINNITFGDVGFAVIFVTIFIKFILSPLTKKSIRSQVLMKKMEPEIKQIKKETKSEYQPEMFLAKDKVTCVIAKQDEKIGRVKTEIAPINEFGIDVDVIDREINYIGETSDILSELINVNHQSIGE